MKTYGIYIDCRNRKQVDWWNKRAKKKVTVVDRNPIVETKTGRTIAWLFVIAGKLAKEIFDENDQFLENPVTVTSEQIEKWKKRDLG